MAGLSQLKRMTTASEAVPGAWGQVFQDLKGNSFIQAWTAFGQAGWKLEGECEPDIAFGLGKIEILGRSGSMW